MNRLKFLPQEGLKLLACLTMLVDHIGVLFFRGYTLRLIGRLSFPIFCFLLAEGALHTRSPKKYALRLAIGALLSEIPFDLAFYGGMDWGHQNVMVTLLLGYCALWSMEQVTAPFWKALSAAPFLLLAELAQADYGWAGVALILLFHFTRELEGKSLARFIGMALIFNTFPWSALFTIGGVGITGQMFGVLAIFPISLYSGKKLTRSRWLQWAFYRFYPVHLLALWIVNLAR